MPEYEHFCTQKDKFDYITAIQLVVIVRDKIVIKWFSCSYDAIVKECWLGCGPDYLCWRCSTNLTELVQKNSKYNTLINHTPL